MWIPAASATPSDTLMAGCRSVRRTPSAFARRMRCCLSNRSTADTRSRAAFAGVGALSQSSRSQVARVRLSDRLHQQLWRYYPQMLKLTDDLTERNANGTAFYRGSGRLLKPRPGHPQRTCINDLSGGLSGPDHAPGRPRGIATAALSVCSERAPRT